MINKNSKRKAFTLVEVIVATGLLSLLILSVFDVFSSSGQSFNDGSWRIATQRKAQIFLLRVREVLEQANHGYSFDAEGNFIKSSKPIFVSSTYYNHNNLASVTEGLILCGAVIKPHYEANPALCIPERPGIWKGFALQYGSDNLLKLYKTGDWDSMNPSPPAYIGQGGDSNFLLNNIEGDFSITLEDVDSVSVDAYLATDTKDLNRAEVLMRCKIRCLKPKSKGRVSIVESITARITNRDLDEIQTNK